MRLVSAESAYWRGELDSARIGWTTLLADDAVAADSLVYAEIRTWLGLIAWRKGEYETARSEGELALDLKLRHGYEAALPRSYNALGLLAWNEGRLFDALELFHAGLPVAQRVGDRGLIAKLTANEALVLSDLARFPEARAGLERAGVLAHDAGEARVEGNALTNLAMLDVRVGEAAAAIPRLQAAREIYRRVEYAIGEQNALGQLSTVYASLGDVGRAFAVLDSANVLAEQQGLKQEQASNLELFGDLYWQAGDARRALHYFDRAQALNQQLGLDVERGTVHRKIATVHRELGATAAALRSAKQAAEMHAGAGAALEQLYDLAFIIQAQRKDTTWQGREAERLARVLAVPSARLELGMARARIAEYENRSADVLRILANLAQDVPNGGFTVEAEAAVLTGVAQQRMGRQRAALVSAAHALALLEQARLTAPTPLLRSGFAARHADQFERIIRVQLLAGDTAAAFASAERARGREAGGAAALDGATRAALQRVDVLTAALREAEAAGEAVLEESLARELTRARADFDAAFARTTWGAGKTAASSAAVIARTIAPGEAILSYYIGPDSVFAFAVTRSGLRARTVGASTAIIGRARTARDLLTDTTRSAESVLHALRGTLIAPFAAQLRSVRRLYVVPHGALSYIPFSALYDTASHQYLVERHSIAYLPSAADVTAARALHPVPDEGVVILKPLPRELPGTNAEARAVRRAWPRATVLAKGKATVASALAALESGRSVHISTHGALDVATPLFSSIRLAPTKGGRDRLEIHDIFATRVRAPLVFLSGCETGLGSASRTGFESADDAGTFSRALISAGAQSVVSTAWRIEDRSAAELSRGFYRELRRLDAADALASAQRVMLRAGPYRSPFYWAPYMLTGNVRFRANS